MRNGRKSSNLVKSHELISLYCTQSLYHPNLHTETFFVYQPARPVCDFFFHENVNKSFQQSEMDFHRPKEHEKQRLFCLYKIWDFSSNNFNSSLIRFRTCGQEELNKTKIHTFSSPKIAILKFIHSESLFNSYLGFA